MYVKVINLCKFYHINFIVAGLQLLATHAHQFGEYIVKDTQVYPFSLNVRKPCCVQHMYDSLCSWSSHANRECKLLGFQALDAFFREVHVHVHILYVTGWELSS